MERTLQQGESITVHAGATTSTPTEVTLQPCESILVQAAAVATAPPTAPEPIPPPTTPEGKGIPIGDLTFNGALFATKGLPGQPWSYARFVIPAGQGGKQATISYSEYSAFGGKQISKTVTFSKTPGDFAAPFPGLAYGSSGHITVAFETPQPNAVTVMGGEIWYMNFINRLENGKLSASRTDNGNFQITPGVPT